MSSRNSCWRARRSIIAAFDAGAAVPSPSSRSPDNSGLPLLPSPYYADGEALRPKLRGAVHLLGTILISAALLGMLGYEAEDADCQDQPAGFLTSAVSCGRWQQERLAGFLAGKLCSYAASAYLHRSEATTRSIETYRVALKIDFFAVGVSIAATGIPTAYHHLELYYGVSGALLALTGVLVVLSLELPRIIVTLTHVVLTIVFIGYATYWNAVWAAGSVAYALAFACFGPVAARADPKQEATLRCVLAQGRAQRLPRGLPQPALRRRRVLPRQRPPQRGGVPLERTIARDIRYRDRIIEVLPNEICRRAARRAPGAAHGPSAAGASRPGASSCTRRARRSARRASCSAAPPRSRAA